MSDLVAPWPCPEPSSTSSHMLRPTGVRAASFCALGAEPKALAGALGAARGGPGTPGGAILFASGRLAGMRDRVLDVARAELGNIPLVFAAAGGVLTERGEHEGTSALAGLIWRGGTAVPLLVSPHTAADTIGSKLAEQVSAALGDAAGTVVLLAQPQGFTPHTLDALRPLAPHATFIGGGTLPRGAFVASGAHSPSEGTVVGLALRGLGRPAVRSAAACRLLAPLAPITEARGPMVLRMGELPALDALTASTSGLPGRPLVLAVLAPPSASSSGAPAMLVRGIRGVDPSRKGVMVSDEVAPGMLMSFAVCDAASSRASFASCVRDVDRQLAGAAPEFGILISCAGRGANLYGERDVDTRIVRDRFPSVPFAGMFSAFEIGPFQQRPALHLYTGVLAMFGAAS